MDKADSRLAPSQWKTSLQSNVVSHWLGANLESALNISPIITWTRLSHYCPCMWESENNRQSSKFISARRQCMHQSNFNFYFMVGYFSRIQNNETLVKRLVPSKGTWLCIVKKVNVRQPQRKTFGLKYFFTWAPWNDKPVHIEKKRSVGNDHMLIRMSYLINGTYVQNSNLKFVYSIF